MYICVHIYICTYSYMYILICRYDKYIYIYIYTHICTYNIVNMYTSPQYRFFFAQELKMSQMGLEIDVTDERGGNGCDGRMCFIWQPVQRWAIHVVYLPNRSLNSPFIGRMNDNEYSIHLGIACFQTKPDVGINVEKYWKNWGNLTDILSQFISYNKLLNIIGGFNSVPRP